MMGAMLGRRDLPGMLRRKFAGYNARSGIVAFTGLQPTVREMLARAGLTELIGEGLIYWSAIKAIIQLHERREIQRLPPLRRPGR